MDPQGPFPSGRLSTGQPHEMGSTPSAYFQRKKPSTRMAFFFGAGYGSRTRLHGLGSRCITDIRILHRGGIISKPRGKINHFLSAETSPSQLPVLFLRGIGLMHKMSRLRWCKKLVKTHAFFTRIFLKKMADYDSIYNV